MVGERESCWLVYVGQMLIYRGAGLGRFHCICMYVRTYIIQYGLKESLRICVSIECSAAAVSTCTSVHIHK